MEKGMTTIRIPDDDSAVLAQLEGVSKLLHAQQWERAALITALVGPPTGRTGRPSKKSLHVVTYRYSVATLAALNFPGLRSQDTVRHYRDQWCKNRPVPDLGDEIDLDDPPLPEWEGTNTARVREQQARKATSVTSSDLRDELERDPEAIITRMADEARDRADASRSGGMRLVPDEPVEAGPNPRGRARELLNDRLVHAKHDLQDVIRDMPEQFEHLPAGSEEHLWELADELLELVEKLRLHRAEYGETEPRS
jgi:hypothetical protein